MEEKEYILGLDVSTSCIGICLYENLGDEGKLIMLNHLEPKVKENTRLDRIKSKADLSINKIIETYGDFNIKRIIVEKPLMNSLNQKTALTLALFNEYLTYYLGEQFELEIDFITVHNSRKYALPELLGGDSRMWSDFPKEVAGLKKSKWSKFLIMYLVSQRYPDVVWLMNNNLKVCKKNFDRADSIVATLGFMVKEGHWKKMGGHEYWGNIDVSYNTCVKIIEKNVAYEKFAKEHIDNKKELIKKERKKVKMKYLNEIFDIKSFINVEF